MDVRASSGASSAGGTQRFTLFHQRLKKFAGESVNRRMIGFTLCRAWVYISFFNAAMLLFTEQPAATLRAVYLTSLVTLIVTQLVCGAIGNPLERFFAGRIGQIAPAAITVVGSLLLFFAGADSTLGSIAGACSGVLTGIGSGLILMCWGRVYSTTGGPTSAAECSLAFLLATLLVPIFAVLPSWLQAVIMAILPIGSAILLNREFAKLNHTPYLNAPEKRSVRAAKEDAEAEAAAEGAKVEDDRRRTSPAIMAKLSVSSLVFGSAVGIVRSLYISQSALSDTFATHLVLPLAALLAAIIVIGILLGTRRLDLAFTYRPVLIFMTISCLILPLLSNTFFLTYILTMAGYFCFEILNWVMLTDITFRLSMSAYRVYGFGRAAVSGGILVGEAVGILLVGAPAGPSTQMLYIISFALVLLMVITYTLTLTEQDVARVTRTEARPFKLPARILAAEEQEDATGADTEAPHELTLEQKVEILALRNDITGRAYDVLLSMARGRTAARIEQELYISRGTVNTYSHRIYQKLDIHSRQELYDLIDAVTED